MQFINGLNLDNIRGDIYGGLTAAVVALPLAMAMGVASGVGPIAGLYGAIFVGLFAAMFGGTPAQVSGPTGPMTVVMAVIFMHYTSMFPEDPAMGASLAFTVVVLGGLFQILFGILRVGKYIELVPHPVVSGFMSGIGVIIILLQIGPLLGHAGVSKPLAAAMAIPSFLDDINNNALILGVLVLFIVFGVPAFVPKLNRLLPSPLLALLVGTAAYLIFIPSGSTPIIGDIPTGFPEFTLPTFEFSLLRDMLISSLTLAALGSIDSLLTSLVADNVTRTQHKPDRELIGQGIGNTVAGLFGGLPGAGATMRTVVNVKAGGRTPISGMLHAVVLLAIVLGAGALASDIPKAVLAGILIKVGTDIIDWDYLKRLRNVPKAGIVMMLTVLLLTVFVDLIMAVGVGMVMAAFVFMKRMTDLQLKSMIVLDHATEDGTLREEENDIMKQHEGDLLLFHLTGPMSFGAAKGVSRTMASFNQYKALVLDLSDVPLMDFTSSRAIDDIIFDAQSTGRQVWLVTPRKAVRDVLRKQGILQRLADNHEFGTRIDALRAADGYLQSLEN